MQIEKFELIGNGMKGITISGVKNKVKNQVTILVPYSETYPIPVPTELKKKIQDFKRFMAIVLNVALEPHVNEIFEKKDKRNTPDKVSLVNFLDSLSITSVERKAGTFIMTGKITNADNGTIGLATPKVTASTNYGIYSDLEENFIVVTKEVLSFVESSEFAKMKAKSYFADLFSNNPEEQANMEGKTEKELEDEMIKALEEKGHIIYSPNASESETQAPETQTTATVASDNDTEEF